MRHEDIHRAALRAAAKVALSLTVLGCGARAELLGEGPGGGDSDPDTPDETVTTASGESTTSAGSTTSGTPDAMCSASAPGEPVSLDPTTFACCVDYLGEQISSTWLMPTPELFACCNEVVGQIDLDPGLQASVDPTLVAPTWPEKEKPSCCDVLGNPCTLPCGCTVWGPPVPRALRGRLWSLDALEAA